MFPSIRNWLNRRVIARSSVTPAEWARAFASLPILDALTDQEQQSLRDLAILFLHDKVIEGAHELVMSRHMALIIALQACLPILRLGLDSYDGWTAVIVYPSGFAPERVYRDEYGVEHRVQSNLSGEAWQRGPVILAWDASRQAGQIDGHNLVIHEFAHKLDMQNGVANGYPPLHADMDKAQWVEAFSSGFRDFQYKHEHGKRTGIDSYAASSPAEFFAVLSEVFFERPDIVYKLYPAIYEQLRLFYRQDTLTRFTANNA
ncbi:MAG: zinc-dependent peptidase [Granulosicoccaceae bacterium]|jgi:Mlc titration factor MtfA (ptsG expression regulator)